MNLTHHRPRYSDDTDSHSGFPQATRPNSFFPVWYQHKIVGGNTKTFLSRCSNLQVWRTTTTRHAIRVAVVKTSLPSQVMFSSSNCGLADWQSESCLPRSRIVLFSFHQQELVNDANKATAGNCRWRLSDRIWQLGRPRSYTDSDPVVRELYANSNTSYPLVVKLSSITETWLQFFGSLTK